MDNSEIRDEFLAEAQEHLSSVEDDILTLEKQGADVDADTINHLFRAVHTVKGGAGFLEMDLITSLAHELESVVGLIRSKQIIPDETVCEALLNGIDTLSELVDNPDDENIDISADLEVLKGILNASSESEGDSDSSKGPKRKTRVLSKLDSVDIDGINSKGQKIWKIRIDLIKAAKHTKRKPADIYEDLKALGDIVASTVPIEKIAELTADSAESFDTEFIFASVVEDENMFEIALGFDPDEAFVISVDELKKYQQGIASHPSDEEVEVAPASSDGDILAETASQPKVDEKKPKEEESKSKPAPSSTKTKPSGTSDTKIIKRKSAEKIS